MNHFHKKRCLLLPLLALASATALAQQSPVAAGGEAGGTGGTTSYTVGQVLATAYTTAAGIVIQGVQQPNDAVQLPITLLRFAAQVTNKTQVSITWSTAAEWNNRNFTVEKSKDGKVFNTLAIVKSKGNSNAVQQYQLTDTLPFMGTAYYRLTQTDIAGKTTVSPIVSVTVEALAAQIAVYPNPATAFVTLYLQQAAITPNLSYTLYNALGKVVVSRQAITASATHIPTVGLANGTYWLQVTNQNQTIKTFTLTKN